MSTNKAPPSFCKPEVQYNFKICIFNVYLNISEGYLSLTQTLEFTLTFTLTVLLWHLLPSRPGEVSSWPGHHISFFSFMENLAAPNDVASSPPDCRAAASKLWPEIYRGSGRGGGEAGGRMLRGVSRQQSKSQNRIRPHLCVRGTAVLTGFFHTNGSHYLIHGGSNRVLLTD